jgi:hypothetical protein
VPHHDGGTNPSILSHQPIQVFATAGMLQSGLSEDVWSCMGVACGLRPFGYSLL